MGKGAKDGAKSSPKTIDVYVKLSTGKTTKFDLLPSNTVQTIYTKISGELGVSEDRLQIKYQGKVLKKVHSLGYLGVCRETVLKAEVVEVKRWTIYVKLPSGDTIPIELDNLTQVKYIREHIRSRDGIAPSKQILKISNRRIDSMTDRVMDVGITNEAVLTLEVETEPTLERARDDWGSARDDWGSDGGEGGAAGGVQPGVSEEDKQAVISTFDAAGRNVEVVFSFDTTGSMSACLQKVRDKLQELVKKLLADIPNIRIGIIAHGDYIDFKKYVVKIQDLTADVDALVDFAKNTPSTGGGDEPEAYEWVLHEAQRLEWSEDSAKALVMIGDEVPHPPSYTDQNINWHTELDVLKGMGIKVYGVQAMNSYKACEFYQELAEQTGGAYVKFNNFNLITDMFMAVCYQEADEEQLQNFQEELEAAGTMTEEVKDMITQIQETAKKTPDLNALTKRYVSDAWWDPKLDNGSCQYSYDAGRDEWRPYVRSIVPKCLSDTKLKKSGSGSSPGKGASGGSGGMSKIKSLFSCRK